MNKKVAAVLVIIFVYTPLIVIGYAPVIEFLSIPQPSFQGFVAFMWSFILAPAGIYLGIAGITKL